MSDSTTGGYIAETSSGVADVIPLENAVHDMIVGLTNLNPQLVRPAFQESPLANPPRNTDWCAFFIRDSFATNFPAISHVKTGDGHNEITDWVDKEIMLYFYGPQSEKYAGMVRRGLHVEQNHWKFRQSGITVKRVGNVTQMPELVNEKWIRRCDLIVYATVENKAAFAVFNLTALADGGQVWEVETPQGETPQGGTDLWEDERPGSGSFLNVNR
jgi:hypothetical protein